MFILTKPHDSGHRHVFDTAACSFSCDKEKTVFKISRSDQIVTTLNPKTDFIAFAPDDALDAVAAFARGEEISVSRMLMHVPDGPWEGIVKCF